MKPPLMLLIIATLLAAALQLPAQPAGDGSSRPAAKIGVKNVEVDEATGLLKKNKEIVVLDVRTTKEYTQGHIAGAKNIDYYAPDFHQKLAALPKNKTYLLHCATGGRSAKARDMMKQLKFESVFHLEGGFKAWEKAGKPVER